LFAEHDGVIRPLGPCVAPQQHAADQVPVCEPTPSGIPEHVELPPGQHADVAPVGAGEYSLAFDRLPRYLVTKQDDVIVVVRFGDIKYSVTLDMFGLKDQEQRGTP
jgi:hypothetical protein